MRKIIIFAMAVFIATAGFMYFFSKEEKKSVRNAKTDVNKAVANSGYVVFKPDYRGHGNSEGKPEGAYYSPAYTTDVLNAVASIKKFKDADPARIGMWGHSLGGNIVLRTMVVSKDIKV